MNEILEGFPDRGSWRCVPLVRGRIAIAAAIYFLACARVVHNDVITTLKGHS